MLEPLSIRLFIRAPLAAGPAGLYSVGVDMTLGDLPWSRGCTGRRMDHKITFYRSTGAPPNADPTALWIRRLGAQPLGQ